jgi:hypothetical protein
MNEEREKLLYHWQKEEICYVLLLLYPKGDGGLGT